MSHQEQKFVGLERELLRSPIKRLVVRPVPDGGFEFETVSVLASMVRLDQTAAQTAKLP